MSENEPVSVPSSCPSSSPQGSRDNRTMNAVAISMAIDGSINPALADPSPRQSSSEPVIISTGLAGAGQTLKHGLGNGAATISPVLKLITNLQDEGAHKETSETMVEKVVHTASDIASAVKDTAAEATIKATEVLPERVKDVASAAAVAIPDSVKEVAVTVKDVTTDAASTLRNEASKTGESIDPAQVTDPEGMIPVSAMNVDAEKKDRDVKKHI
ncbi:hypothetical protein FKW77_002911 [Venturia effusa]|uniref:Uncharacterized protein n=1 Tax=Venturia effusa TaxID=50376 RepID=A0A517LQV1_9PEZI|nr:hypothetical protein FKW77_002911 [Venturia effusa]